jgi:hypothetical protein
MAREASSNRLLAWGLAVLLLALGATTGVAADRLLLHDGARVPRRGPPSPEEILQRMRHELELSDGQARAVVEILETRRRDLATLFARVDPEAEVIREEANGRIRALLEPSQRARFDAHVAEIERRRAELRRRYEVSRSGQDR